MGWQATLQGQRSIANMRIPQMIRQAFQTVRNLAAQPIETARHYSWRKCRHDLIAGLTVAVVEIPQAMAYALIAGVPPQYGLYTSIIQGFFGALFASNEHLSSGPTNTQSLLIAATVARLVDPGNPQMYLQLVIGLGLVKGVIQLIFAAARMGNLIRYVSRSVIVGFAAGAGALIVAGQLPNLLGLPTPSGSRPLPGVAGDILRIVPHLSDIHWPALAIAAGTLAIIVGSRMISRLVPGPLIGVVAAGICVAMIGWEPAELPQVGPIDHGLPSQFIAPWHMTVTQAESLLGGAFALALLGMIETVAIGKSIASHTGQRIDANQEFLVQGAANVLGAFCQNIPGSASFTRSALNHQAGGRTRFAGAFSAIAVAGIFLMFAPMAAYIPLAALGAVLLVVAYSLVDWRYIFRVAHTSRSDAVVCLVTFLSAITLPLHYAIYVGVFLNLALYMRRASQLHINELVQSRGGPLQERPITDRSGESSVVFLSLEGDLFFGVADELQDQLTSISGSGVRVMILRLKRTHMIDATVMSVLEEFVVNMRERDRHVVLCGLRPELYDRLRSFGLCQVIGEENIFQTRFGVFASAKAALRRARELVGQSIDADALLAEEELDEEVAPDPGVDPGSS